MIPAHLATDAFAVAALAEPTRAAAAPVLRAILRAQPGCCEHQADGRRYLVAPFADTPQGLGALAQLLQTGAGLRCLFVQARGRIYSGEQMPRWLPCYAQRRQLGMQRGDCRTLAREVNADRYQPQGQPHLHWPVGCGALAAHAGGTVERMAPASVPDQLDALAARLGLNACPWFCGAARRADQSCQDVTLPSSV